MDQKVKCDKCGAKIRIRLKTVQRGQLEYKYFTCQKCKTAYVASCTDPALRREQARYEDLITQANSLTLQAQKLLHDNVARSRELIDQYPFTI